MTRPLVVYGAGGLGRELVALAEAMAEWDVLGFLDDNLELNRAIRGGLPVLGGAEWLSGEGAWVEGLHVALGVGAPALRRRLGRRVLDAGGTLATLVHPSVIPGPRVQVNAGAVVNVGSTLTVDIEVGEGCLVNPGCALGHDVVIGEYAVLSPGVCLSGVVEVAEGAEIGTGAVVLPGVTVGAWSVVGAGAVVHRDVPSNTVVAGVPARTLRERPQGWQLE
ncbi:MAG: acetyltransferase [Gemmatimonadota bacterium]